MITNYPELDQLNLDQLKAKVKELEVTVAKYRNTLEEHELLDSISEISDTEKICIEEISKLKELSEKGAGLTLEDVKILDILHANLMKARGLAKDDKKDKKKQKPTDVKELLKIVEGSKK